MSPADRHLLIVAGMHRSGTSLFTCMAHHLGAAVGEALAEAEAEDNKLGYWEPEAVIELHEEAFASLGMRSDDCKIIPESWWQSPAAYRAGRRVREWLAQFAEDAPLVVVKDPRICRFLPLWIRAATLAGHQPHLVMPVRNPLEVAASQRRRQPEAYVNTQRLLVWWLLHVLEAERHSRGFPRLFYAYPDLLQDWRLVMQRVAEEAEIHWPVQIGRAASGIAPLVEPALRRNRFESTEIQRIDRLGWVAEVYALLVKAGQGIPLPTERLDSITAQLHRFLAPLASQETAPHGQPSECAAWDEAVGIRRGAIAG